MKLIYGGAADNPAEHRTSELVECCVLYINCHPSCTQPNLPVTGVGTVGGWCSMLSPLEEFLSYGWPQPSATSYNIC